MRNITLEELLEAGCHFGHQVTRQNPKARDYVFEARDNIHIIDLGKTKEGLEEAGKFVVEHAKKGGSLIVLGAKKQASDIVKAEVKRAREAGATDLYFVTNRWIGGTLTNYGEVSKNYRRLKELTSKLENRSEQAGYTKKEIGKWKEEKAKLEVFYGGIADMKKPADAVFIIDTHLEDLAVKEVRAMGAKIVGICDTNSDPTLIDYVIPANDDAVGSIELITKYIVDAWLEGKQHVAKEAEKKVEDDKKAAQKAEKDAAKAKEDQEKAEKKAQEKREQDKLAKIAALKAENAADAAKKAAAAKK